MLLSSLGVNGIHLRERVDERLQREQAACNSLIVTKAEESGADNKHNGGGAQR